ncbi:MAG: SdrD B-like domain-containing protein, partial [Lewinella sp.]
AWNFIQYKNEFVDPECLESDAGHVGKERSDCMQRNFRCVEQRSEGLGPWDGFGDFSAIAIHRYLVGASVQRGQVSDRNQMKDFRLNRQEGFPNMTLEGGERVYTRDVLQPEELGYWERHDLPGEEQLNQQVYLIYGSAHATQAQANIVYKPLRYEGTLPPVIDPTDPATFAQLKDPQYAPYLSGPFDITLKLIYEDGTVTHALNPFHSFARAPYDGWLGIWRWDISNFSLVVPGDKELAKVEMYKRPFTARDASDDIEGNINFAANNITAQNFMDDAVFLAEYEFGRALALGSNTIGNRVWHDLNQDGIQDRNEPGIEGVSLIAWEDSDGDNIPDSRGFLGVRKTDEDGFYSFSGLGPGNYLVFVWSLDNWGEGEPLQGMIPTIPFVEDPNTDLNNDSHGRPGNLEWGLSDLDFVSGQITLTADGEPLNDGDREDDWFDYDPSGNMTIDFGFFVEGANSTGNQIDPSLAKVYPNPGADFIRFETTDYSGRTLSILNAHGQLVLETKLSAAVTPLNVGALPSGVYATVMKNEFGTVIWSANFVKLGR